MGLFKRCRHRGRQRDRCDCPWWGSFRGDRVSLSKWANQDVRSKDQAQAILDEIRTAIRVGTFDSKGRTVAPAPATPLGFREFAGKYFDREVAGRSDAGTTRNRLDRIIGFFGDRAILDITASDAEDFLASLRQPVRFHAAHKADRVRQPSTINRYRALLVRVFSWGVEKDYLDRNPFAKPGIRKSLVGRCRENDPRSRRLIGDELERLRLAANPMLWNLILVAVLTGMRRGEMLSLTWEDLEVRPGWVHLKAQNTKARRERFIPISPHVQGVFTALRLDAAGKRKALDVRVFSNEVSEPIGCFATAWKNAKTRAGLTNLRFHDLRREFGSRLLETGGNLIQAQDLLGHADPKMTRRYLNLGDDALIEAIGRLSETVVSAVVARTECPVPDPPEVSQSLHIPAEVQPDALSGPTANAMIH